MDRLISAAIYTIGVVTGVGLAVWVRWVFSRKRSWGLPACPDPPPMPPVKPPKEGVVLAKEICLNCRWWANRPGLVSDDASNVRLACHRHPPYVICTGRVHNPCGPSSSGIDYQHPMTVARDWCGEWEAVEC